MRPLRYLALAATVTLFACGGCDDDSSSTNNANNTTNNSTANNTANNTSNNVELPEGCEDQDGDGYGDGLTCDGAVDCDDGDDTIHPGAEEACYDMVDNDCDGATDEGCPECEEGATQSCGSDEGRCVSGTQTCTDGVWSDCVGSEGPFGEECNGQDDDCDGEVDENGDLLCDDGTACNGIEVCEAGACVPGDAVDCSSLDGPCVEGRCSEKDRGCRAFPLDNGTACEDGNFCTVTGVCDVGECVVTPRDCSSEDDQCNTGVCDEGADACVKQPRSDGLQCDDGNFCTIMDTCTAGSCGGPQRDCSSAGDQCNDGVCDEATDSCVPSPVPNGNPCDDGQYCNVGETCQAGQCTGGSQRSCTAQGGSCRTGTCDEATDSCSGDPVPDGTACEDGFFCTTGDTCSAGTCMGGGARDCSGVAETCKVGSCNENLNTCVPLPAPDGTVCDDTRFCTTGDSCQAGSCTGAMRDCSAVGDLCNTGVCDDTMDSCLPQPVSDGTACPDSLFCTQSEVCVSGACESTPRDCSGQGDDCNDGICDENSDACAAQPKVDGTMCNDGLFCTTNDSCQAGACAGGPRSCSQFDDVCTIGMCDEDNNLCEASAAPDNTSCDDGQFCTEGDLCNGGVCSGAPRNCSSFGDQCNNGVCDEANDVCAQQPRPDSTPCNDGEYCTVGDVCTAGACGGAARDCSGLGDDCNVGECDENANTCVTTPAIDGTSCDDGAYCTEVDECLNGNCVGTQRDCDAAAGGDPCFDGVCDDAQNLCIAMDNGSCDTCLTGTPTANAGPDQNVVPDTTVFLNGGGSTDPDGQTLTYSWRIVDQPLGSTSTLSSTTSATPTLLADISGRFEICLAVTDSDTCQSSEDCMVIDVVPTADLHIELTWANDNSDIDLHYLAGTERNLWFDAKANNGSNVTCSRGGPPARGGPDNFWCVLNPDWGGTPELWSKDNNGANDPSLDVDNVAGYGPENINQSSIEDGVYTIGVHYFADFSSSADPPAGDQNARIRVYVNGALEAEYNRNLSCRKFWEVARVTVSGNGTSIASSGLSNQTFDVVGDATDDVLNALRTDGSNTGINQAPRGACRCDIDADCWGDEVCSDTSVGKFCTAP